MFSLERNKLITQDDSLQIRETEGWFVIFQLVFFSCCWDLLGFAN